MFQFSSLSFIFPIEYQSLTSKCHREIPYQYHLLKDILYSTFKSTCKWRQHFERKSFLSHCTFHSPLWFQCKDWICKRATSLLYINEFFQFIKNRVHCKNKWTLKWVYISVFIDPKSHPQCNDLCLIIV